MKKYIKQLLADIQTAHRSREDTAPSPITFEEEIDDLVKGITITEQYDLQPFSYHCGLTKEQFPMPDRLDMLQMQQLCTALNKLLFSWNLSTDIPDSVPAIRKYLLLIDLLEQPIPIVNQFHFRNLSFCKNNPEQCLFGDHCTCIGKDNSVFEAMEKERLEKKKAVKEQWAQENAEHKKKRQELIAKTDPAIVAKIEKEIQAMDRYVNHLLTDLKAAAPDLPKQSPIVEEASEIMDIEWIEELANCPYKTIAEWTGIPSEALPDESRLTGDQIERLVEGLDELWEAWYWLFDMEDHIHHPIVRYRMYWDCWTDSVQYLPNSGFELELCNGGEIESCRMGEDCICIENPPDFSWDEPPFLPWENGQEWEDGDLPF